MPELASFRAFWWGVLHAIGMFGVDDLTGFLKPGKIPGVWKPKRRHGCFIQSWMKLPGKGATF